MSQEASRRRRVALFLDFENLYTSLKNRTRTPEYPYGLPPKMDFERLVAFIEDRFGTLDREDFIVVANFTHYDPQSGGLNRVATVIDAQSFLHPRVRRRRQPSPGKKWVIHNYADMRLAFELGRHVETRPADLYILGSGDEAFTALGRTLQEMGYNVIFMVPDLRSPSTDQNILAEFPVFDFLSTQSFTPDPPAEEEEAPTPPEPDETLVQLVGRLRRAFRSAIPLDLVQALWPDTASWEDALNKARGRGRIDLWEDPAGIPCISLREERLYGKVHVMPVREDVARTARLLRAVRELAAQAPQDADRAFWRRGLQKGLGISAKEAKRLLALLLETGVLQDGRLNRPNLSLTHAQRLAQRLRSA